MRPGRVEYSIAIDAPIEAIWRVMTDLPNYPTWNPFIVGVEGISGSPQPGQPMLLHVRWADGSTVKSQEQIGRVDPPAPTSSGRLRATLQYDFRGPLHTFGLVRGSRIQTLDQQLDGATLYRTYEDFHGWLAMGVPIAKVRDGFVRHARALKAHVEGLKDRSTMR